MEIPNNNTDKVQAELSELYCLVAIDILEERAEDGDEEARLLLEYFVERAKKLLDDIRGK